MQQDEEEEEEEDAEEDEEEEEEDEEVVVTKRPGSCLMGLDWILIYLMWLNLFYLFIRLD